MSAYVHEPRSTTVLTNSNTDVFQQQQKQQHYYLKY